MFSGSSSGFFNSGVTVAAFSMGGIVEVKINVFTICVSVGSRQTMQSFKSVVGMGSK